MMRFVFLCLCLFVWCAGVAQTAGNAATFEALDESVSVDSISQGGSVSIDSSDTKFAVTTATSEIIKPPKIRLSFAEKNSGAFKLKKQGGRKSPLTAALCSAFVPGLGQMYNGQYYKPPVIYAGGVALWYFLDVNLKERRIYDKELNARYNHDTASLNLSLTRYNDNALLDIRNYYQNNFELSIIIAGVVYLLNIIDAIVYAHLSKFDVSPSLSMQVEPYARTNFYTKSKMPLDAGLSVSLTFK
ncbi:MAG: DUF5683 domain-containing protein [Bacteroidales bacterium]|jgi:hypothetical protein|nr:DUF5683 domain-containing protein [Bacteroidales bacterium]